MIEYPHEPPEAGAALEVAPGVRWIRMPLAFKPSHINLWLLEDEDEQGACWTLVDTGYRAPDTHALWERHLAETLGGGRVRRIIVTHHHPDHVGCAGWLADKTGAMVWMTATEYLSAHAASEDVAGFDRASNAAHFMRHGLGLIMGAPPPALTASTRREPPLPRAYRRLQDGEVLRIGAHDWEVRTVFGHAPEHAALACEAAGLLISGDQILPTITPNVSVWGNQPEGNPLRQYLDSLGRFDALAPDTLVLPSHGKVFRGLPARIAALRAHHAEELDALHAALDRPRCAAEILPVLFKRPLDDVQRILAMGEAIAHLHWLYYAGRARRAIGSDGIVRFQRA